MRIKSLLTALALVVLLSSTALAEKTIVHFFVLPASIPSEQLVKFDDFLVHTAGGFTATRSYGGAMTSLGKDYAPENLSYTVAAPKHLRKEIMDYLKKNCGQKEVFMLVWPADRPGL
ncbi:MAG: hypothetical protein P4L39_04305 [Humidesulfovibrio sp.]|nr:hypothetical protein [Humidesulfovibrio sp.]